MKKFIFSLVLAFLLVSSVAIASDTPSVKRYVIPNTSAISIVTNVSTSTIIPGKCRILAYEVAPLVSGSGNVGVSLYDTTALTVTNIGTYDTTTYMIGESQSANTESAYREPPGPIDISSGLSVYQGSYSVVTIWYEQRIP